MESSDIPIRPPWDMQSQMQAFINGNAEKNETINTKHILFIVSGAFEGLDDIIKKEQKGQSLGLIKKNKKIKLNC